MRALYGLEDLPWREGGGGIFSGTTQYFKMGREEEGSQALLTQPPLVLFAMRFDGYPFAALRPYEEPRCSSLWTLVDKIHIRHE